MDTVTEQTYAIVPEDRSRLVTLTSEGQGIDPDQVVELLRRDFVVLATNVSPDQADTILHDVAERLGLLESMKLQAAFAGILGHRQRIGKYGMTVNKRGSYQFIVPHSEGDANANMQLAGFYCFENSTDGGESILVNMDGSSDVWPSLRERVVRIAPGSKRLDPGKLSRARALYGVHHVSPEVLPDDQIVEERTTEIPGVKLVDALARLTKARSSIAGREVQPYWTTVATSDFSSLHSYVALLKHGNLLRMPEGGLELSQMDHTARLRAWSSGVDHNKLFKCKITHKLSHGELVLQNNLTWAHGVSNWSPDSGTRRVEAIFA